MQPRRAGVARRLHSTHLATMLTLIGLCSAPCVSAQVSLFDSPAMVYDAGLDSTSGHPDGDATCVAAGDLNNDGRADLVVAHYISSGFPPKVSVLLSKIGADYFEPEVKVATGGVPLWVRLADVSGDDRLDLVTLNTTATVSVQRGGGGATFSSPTSYSLAGAPDRLELADLDGDGDQDIAVTGADAGSVEVLLNSGGGVFGTPTSYLAGGEALAIGDVTGDGRLDLVTAGAGEPSFHVVPGLGNGSFGPTTHWITASSPSAVLLTDMNLDGSLDVVVTLPEDQAIRVHPNAGNGSFVFANSYAVPSGEEEPSSIAAADMDADGIKEIVVSYRNDLAPSRNVAVFERDGAGMLLAPMFYDAGTYPRSIAVADFTGDGSPDVGTASFGDIWNGGYMNTAMLLVNHGGTLAGGLRISIGGILRGACSDDFNRDGKPDLLLGNSASTQFLAGNGDGTYGVPVEVLPAGQVIAGDVNRDGKRDAVLATPSGDITIGLGDGAGGFSPVSTSLSGFGLFRQSLTGDLNRDGVLDLVLSTGNAGIATAIATGSGMFPGAIYYPLPGVPHDIDIADVNRDGFSDVVVATDNGLLLMAGGGNGSLGVEILNSLAASAVCVLDFNRDGLPDIAFRAIPPSSAPGIYILRATGPAQFVLEPRIPSLATYGDYLDSWDVNRDGIPDLLAEEVRDNPAGAPVSVSLWLGNGSGFGARSTYLVGGTRWGVGSLFMAAIAANRDAQPDLIGFTLDSDPVTASFDYRASLLTAPFESWSADYAAAPLIQTVSNPEDMAVGDLNRDGKLDLVVMGHTDSIQVYLGNGGGGLTVGASYTLTPSAQLFRILLADFDRNGTLDLATAWSDYTGQEYVSVSRGTGNGTFVSTYTYITGATNVLGDELAAGDFDRNGSLELMVTPAILQPFPPSTSSHLLIGDGAGGFTVAPMGPPYQQQAGRSAALYDLDHDGDLDRIYVTENGMLEIALYSPGGGTFTTSNFPIDASVDGGGRFAMGDFNRNGITDMAINASGYVDGQYMYFIQVLYDWNGVGFSTSRRFDVSSIPRNDIEAVDLTGDNVLDLVTIWGSVVGVVLLRGLEDGTFADPVVLNSSAFFVPTLVTGDLNRDGRLDIMVTRENENTILILLGSKTGTATSVPVMAAAGGAPRLMQNTPNPFNPRTTIRFTMPHPGRARLMVFDATGRLISTLVDGALPAGERSVVWAGQDDSGRPVSSGIYFYKLVAEGVSLSRKMVLLK